ncbi:hypothetical protein ABK040_004684 [Willaertia magna]
MSVSDEEVDVSTPITANNTQQPHYNTIDIFEEEINETNNNDNVIDIGVNQIIPATHQYQPQAPPTWTHDEIMKGWILKYNYDNVPPEVLVEIFKFLDTTSLLNSALVSKSWYYATLHDALWESSVRKLFHSWNDQESNYYLLDMSRLNKRYGKPVPPPPRPKIIEDYVTIENGKIISYHTLRALNIEQGKKKLNSKLRRDRKEYMRAKRLEIYENMNDLRYRYFFGFATVIYIAFFLFFAMVAIYDAIPESIIPRWHLFSFIPLWFVYLFGFGLLFYLTFMYCNANDKEILFLAAIILIVLIGALALTIMAFLNVAVLPITIDPVTKHKQHTINWFIVLIPAYIFALVAEIIMNVGVGITLIDDWTHNATPKEKCKHFWTAMLFSSLTILLVCAIAMLGFNLEYPQYFPPFYTAIPVFIIVVSFIVITIRQIWKERNDQYASDKYFLYYGLIFFIMVLINVLTIGSLPWSQSYAWFSSLLPLTAAYAFICRLIYHG